MRFLVTGATGFIGTHLCRRLLADGHHVTGLVRSPHKIADDLRDRLEVLKGDLSLFDDPAVQLPEADVVVHLAAVIAGDNMRQYDDINFRAVETLLAALRNQSWTPRRLLFASSLAAAGPSQGRPLTEDDTPAPIDAYGRAKLAAEGLMRAQPFPTTTFRPSLVLGPGDPATLTLFKMAHAGLAVLPGFAPQNLSVIDVGELVEALVVMANVADDDHHTYFATSDVEVTNSELLRAMAAAMDRRLSVLRLPKLLLFIAMIFSTAASKLFRFRNQLDLKQYQQMTAPEFVCTSARLQSELGWRPGKHLDTVLADTVAGYRSLGQLPQ